MSNSSLFDLSEQVISQARKKGLTIATAESCTGGWIAKCLTDISGSSAVIKGGLVAYSNEIKEHLLGVSLNTLMEHGAVSAETAAEMAINCQQCFDVDIAISVTGIAGPGGGSPEKPVGLVYMATCFDNKTQVHKLIFDGKDRDDVRAQAVKQALKFALELMTD